MSGAVWAWEWSTGSSNGIGLDVNPPARAVLQLRTAETFSNAQENDVRLHLPAMDASAVGTRKVVKRVVRILSKVQIRSGVRD